MNTLVQITQAGQVIGILTGLGIDLALKIKALFETNLGPDVQVNIGNFAAQTESVNQDTIDSVNAWLAAHNLPAIDAGGSGGSTGKG